MNFPLSEEAAYQMTDAPKVNRSHAPEPIVVKTPAADRRIVQEAPITLHRDEDAPESATQEVYTCMKNACRGMVYDAQHWKDLPGDTPMDRMSLVMCRGGRFPYLLLTFAVGFFAFFLAYRIVSSCSSPSVATTAAPGYPAFAPAIPQNVMVGPPIL